jgi:RsiW-degrading membrane proteinase PrsW (M82 family)
VAALLTAAVLVPVLYLVYLYEAQVYRDEPARVVGLTLVSGAVLGVATATVANAVVPSSSPLNPTASGVLLISAVLLPIVQEIVKPVPALFLRPLAKFNQTIDGLVFGVATGLGFAAAETIVDFSRVITYEPLRTSSADWLFPMLSIAVLTPLMQASCTGAIMASLWRHSPKGASSALYAIGIPVAILAHVGFSLGSQLITRQGANQPSVLAWQAAVVAGLLVYIRFLVHRALLDEAGSLGLHLSVCPYCRRRVETAGFCSSCGSASSAGPRTSGSPRLASETPRPDPAGRAAD